MPAARVIRSRRKTIAIEVRADGEVWVRVPMRTSQQLIDRVLDDKSDWIARQVRAVQVHMQTHPIRRFQPGEQFLFLGQPVTLQFSPTLHKSRLQQQELILPEANRPDARAALESFYRAQARAHLQQRVSDLAYVVGQRPNRVRLSSARTRWGSCSSKGAISLNWRLIMAPPAIIDYVVLHELTHLRIQNHSKDFWQLLSTWQPDCRQRRDWLKKHGHTLTLD